MEEELDSLLSQIDERFLAELEDEPNEDCTSQSLLPLVTINQPLPVPLNAGSTSSRFASLVSDSELQDS
jgi:hypothetical protein